MDEASMIRARKIVEDHIAAYGMVPHPDKLKEAVAVALACNVPLLSLVLVRKDMERALDKINRALGVP